MTADAVFSLRRSLGMSQAQFAAMLRVTPAAVSYWESGSRPVVPAMAELMRLKAAEYREQNVVA
jgi:DNA-binding transcriptional regulator YiaG